MKFSDGGWLFREGFDVKFAVHVYDARKEENKLVLYLPYSYVGHKGATLDGGLLTMEVTTPRSNIIGITLYNYKGVQAKAPDFELMTEAITPDISEDEQSYVGTERV